MSRSSSSMLVQNHQGFTAQVGLQHTSSTFEVAVPRIACDKIIAADIGSGSLASFLKISRDNAIRSGCFWHRDSDAMRLQARHGEYPDRVCFDCDARQSFQISRVALSLHDCSWTRIRLGLYGNQDCKNRPRIARISV